MNVPAGLKVYPDQAEVHSNLTKERLISQKRQNFALVASHAGEYTLPKITIAWWNTVTNKYQQAILPEQTIIIKANPDAPQARINSSDETQLTLPTAKLKTPVVQPIIIEKVSNLQWIFLALWLLTCIAWGIHVMYLKRTGSLTTKKTAKTKIIKSANNHYLALMAACKKSDAEQALSLILPWFNSLSSKKSHIEVSSLSEAIALLNNDEFTCAINDVQQYLYGKEIAETKWLGDSLLKATQHINASGIQGDDSGKFNLNPN